VSGLTITAAEKLLKSAGLNSTQGSEAYDGTIPKGDVVGIDPQTNAAGVSRAFRVGDVEPAQLITSRGPEMITVPSVAGKSWSVAKAALLAAGFALSYNHAADIAPGSFTVQSLNPAGGTSQPKGTTIAVKFQGF
jgi:serine/threonine-protein kinase